MLFSICLDRSFLKLVGHFFRQLGDLPCISVAEPSALISRCLQSRDRNSTYGWHFCFQTLALRYVSAVTCSRPNQVHF